MYETARSGARRGRSHSAGRVVHRFLAGVVVSDEVEPIDGMYHCICCIILGSVLLWPLFKGLKLGLGKTWYHAISAAERCVTNPG